MGVFGAIPSGVSLAVDLAVKAGQGAVSVIVDGTTMSFVPDGHRDSDQVWWTRLGSFIESEGLVAAKHAPNRERRKKLNRLRFTDYLPGAKVLVWSTHKTVFIYIKHGLGKREAATAVRAALQAAGRPKLSPVHASLISLGAAGGLHLPMWVAHWPLPKGAIAAAGGSFAVAAVFGASTLVFQWPSHPDRFPAAGASLSPVTAQPASPIMPTWQPTGPRASEQPSAFVQVDPHATPEPVPAATTTPTPQPTPTADPSPLPTSAPYPQPSGVPYPMPSGVATDSPSSWWLPNIFPTGNRW